MSKDAFFELFTTRSTKNYINSAIQIANQNIKKYKGDHQIVPSYIGSTETDRWDVDKVYAIAINMRVDIDYPPFNVVHDQMMKYYPTAQFMAISQTYNRGLNSLDRLLLKTFVASGYGKINFFMRMIMSKLYPDRFSEEFAEMQFDGIKGKLVLHYLDKYADEIDMTALSKYPYRNILSSKDNDEFLAHDLPDILGQSLVHKIYSQLCYRLFQIIINAPKSDKDLILYRGEEEFYNYSPSQMYLTEAFKSTSYDYESSIAFHGTSVTSYIYIPRGNPVYVLDPSLSEGEREIILPPNGHYHIRKTDGYYVTQGMNYDLHKYDRDEGEYLWYFDHQDDLSLV